MVDESGSIGDYYYNNSKGYIQEVLDIFNPSPDGHHVGLVTFGGNSTLQFKLTYTGFDDMVRIYFQLVKYIMVFSC